MYDASNRLTSIRILSLLATRLRYSLFRYCLFAFNTVCLLAKNSISLLYSLPAILCHDTADDLFRSFKSTTL